MQEKLRRRFIRRSYFRTLSQHEYSFRLPDPDVAGVAVGPAGAGGVVAQSCDCDAGRHAVTDAGIGLDDVRRPFGDDGGDDDLKRIILDSARSKAAQGMPRIRSQLMK